MQLLSLSTHRHNHSDFLLLSSPLTGGRRGNGQEAQRALQSFSGGLKKVSFSDPHLSFAGGRGESKRDRDLPQPLHISGKLGSHNAPQIARPKAIT